MNHRLYTTYLALLFFTDIATATENPAWNCEQGPNGEWTCLNQKPATPEQAQPKIITTQSPKTAPQSQPSTGNAATQATTQEADNRKEAAAPIAEQSIEPSQPSVSEQAPAITALPAQETADRKAITQQASQPAAQAVTEQPAKPKLHARIADNQRPVIEKLPARSEAPEKTPKNQGWSCDSGEEANNWNCNLVGPDPKGQAQIVEASEPSAFWFTPTYDQQQERTFQALRGEFDQDPWQNCSAWSAPKNKPKTTSKAVRDSADTDILSDFSEVYDGEILNFAGNIDLRRADQHLLSDKASYDTVAETMDAQGNVLYSEDTLAIASDTASLSMGKDEARLRKAQFIAAEAPIRGSADVMYRDSKTLSRYHEATFTSCPPGNQDWIAHASRLKINRESGLGSAKNAWLEFKGAPVMYLPYISFPVDNRRTSGLLAPTWGSTQRNGADIAAPFYWNIAPNFDTVITPRYMEKRGFMLRNQFRYLTEMSKGSLGTEILPFDEIEDKTRYSATFKDFTRFTPHLRATTDLNYVSDKEYFNDMNNALGFQTNSFLPSNALLSYNRPGILLSTGAYHYQSVDKTIPDAGMPYDVLPRIKLDLNHSFDNMPLALEMVNQYSHFYHNAKDDLTGHSLKVNGQRFSAAPSISLPLEASAGFFIPKITGQYTQYQLSKQADFELSAKQSDSISRVLPIFSVDSGVMFEKDLEIGNSGYIHTLEPRAFYLYIPRVDQNDIPLFDTAAYDTNFYSLFRENRFSGMDRIQDANQITLAGTTRLIDAETGLEPVKLSFGQIIYFQDRTVDLDYLSDTRPAETSTTSNFVGELSGQLTRHLSYVTGAQWDPLSNGFARTQAALKYRNQPDQIFDVGYRWRNNNPNDLSSLAQTQISQSDVSFRWPIAAGWYGLGRWQYSFNFDKTTESFIGIEKETCCWRLRVIGRRYINGATTTDILAPDAKAENALFVQLELKGLTSFGNSVDQFLQQTLPGYRPADYFED